MKYIRIEDKIINTETINIPFQVVDDRIDFNSQGFFKIINQADTIEELCDCIDYVCLPKPFQDAYHKHEIGSVESLKWNREPKRFENVYGAIWTKGEHDEPILKSVAKMNEKGCLELL